MAPHCDTSFPADYTFEVLDELPGVCRHARFFFPPDRYGGGQDGLLLLVTPSVGEPWIGTFASGSGDFSAVLTMPDRRRLCIISGGRGYATSAANPHDWQEFPWWQISEAMAAPHPGLLILATQYAVLAYGRGSLHWYTELPAWGVLIKALSPKSVIGEYRHLETDELEPFELDLLTGASLHSQKD